ncbi:NF-kappa-B inhibitor-interacting Ras-like protein 1 [Desmophyllum pertusum]|uniref:NF-kappa-B inhibitor-interacting Ras-like protein 1 n=1 Tax=Desmophyllum pertusum TaxID=174260 RepID=A0A9X0DBA3_9CNID|nr:NF-kappa-B inhibitor-interacting Ras-like protein 1 [Desmophyllum pertusum]
MPKICLRLVVVGGSCVGKTAVIEQAIFGNHSPGQPTFHTIEDIYDVQLDTDRGIKERIRIFDTAGVDLHVNNGELSKHYLNLADGFLLVFSVTSKKSFQQIQAIKKEIDKNKGKDFPVVVVATKADIKNERECESIVIKKWAEAEKVRLTELYVGDRKALQDPFVQITTRMVLCAGKGYLQSSHSEVKRFLSMRKTSKSISASKDSGLDVTKE